MIKDSLSKGDVFGIAKALYEFQYAVEVDFWVDKTDKYAYEVYEEVLFESNTNFQIANLLRFDLISYESLSSKALTNLINLYDDMVSLEYIEDELGIVQ